MSAVHELQSYAIRQGDTLRAVLTTWGRASGPGHVVSLEHYGPPDDPLYWHLERLIDSGADMAADAVAASLTPFGATIQPCKQEDF